MLTDLNLLITKAYISSDGGWFMDGMVSYSASNHLEKKSFIMVFPIVSD